MTPQQVDDLLTQQGWLAQEARGTAAAEAAAATASPTAWLQRQQQLMKEQQTAFLIQQEQQRMTFMLQQQKNFEMQTNAVMTQVGQQQPLQEAVTASAASLHGMMAAGPVRDAMLVQQQQAEAFEAQQEQQRLEEEKRAEAAEELRLEQERRFLQEQEELLAAQEEADRFERENALENQRLAAELYKVEKQAEALRMAMINRSSGSKASARAPAPVTRPFLIPPNWPKDAMPTVRATLPPTPKVSTKVTPPTKASEQAYNSTTHPTEWHFLNRLVKSKKGTLDEINKAWEEGGIKRARLLRDFVVKVYTPADDHSVNKGRLEALIKLRQSTKEWKRNTQGFEWCSVEDMKAKGWPENKVEGAKKYCLAKKLYKTCPYTGEYKYLVLVSDTITQGQEKLRELEELMEEAGFLNDQFQLGCGDTFEISDEESVPDSKAAAQGKKGSNRTAAKAAALPLIVEGEQDLAGSVAKYKKALLNKRTVLKEVKDRLDAEKCELNDLYKTICNLELAETRLGNTLK
ncbi:unnamed protein product [Symbiodinium sp. CCMP2456]|nr:unnamed protein product [Symbiodinium sp. CCMP2456]